MSSSHDACQKEPLQKKYRVALCGLGRVAQFYLDNFSGSLSDRFQVVAAADPDKSTWAKLPPGAAGVSDFAGLLRFLPDAIVVCTPTSLHFETAQQAIKHGLSVLLEKPAVTNWSQLESLYSEATTPLQVALHGAHAPETLWLAHHIQEWGKLLRFNAQFNDPYLSSHELTRLAKRSLVGSWLDDGVTALSMLVAGVGRPVTVMSLDRNIFNEESPLLDYQAVAIAMIGDAEGTLRTGWNRPEKSKTIELCFQHATVTIDTTACKCMVNGDVTMQWSTEKRMQTRYHGVLREWLEVLDGHVIDNRDLVMDIHRGLLAHLPQDAEALTFSEDGETSTVDTLSAERCWLPTLQQRSLIQVLSYMDVFMAHATYSSLIPEAYALAQTLDRDATFSGWLISTQWSAVAIGTLFVARPFAIKASLPMQRMIVMVCMLMMALSCSLFGLAANPLEGWEWTSAQRGGALFGARALIGLSWSVATMVISVVAVKITPKEAQVQNETFRQFGITLGLGLGPMVSSSLTWVFGLQSVEARAAAPSYFNSLMYIVFFFLIWMVFPGNRNEMDRLLEGATAESKLQNDPNMQQNAMPNAISRKVVFCCGGLFGLQRAFLTAAVETASSLILQVEFGWPSAQIGACTGMVFIWTAFMLLVVGMLKDKLNADMVMHVGACATCASVSFLTPQIGTSAGYILIADAIAFFFAFMAGSVAEGRAMQNAVPGTWCSVENLWVLRNAGKNNLSRFLAPPLARALLAVNGRATYATTLFGLTLLGWLNCAIITAASERSGANK